MTKEAIWGLTGCACCVGAEDSDSESTALRLALTKLFQLHADNTKKNAPQPVVDKSTPPAGFDGSPDNKFAMTLATSHVYLWLEKHREVLKTLMSGGQAAAPLSPVSVQVKEA